MKHKKFRLNWYQATDIAAMERKLEKMAAKGWLLEHVSNLGWHYRRAEPQSVQYAVTYFPAASVYDSGPTREQETYADYCAAAGWDFVSAYGPLQIFRSIRPDPVPIETDEGEKLRAIHRSVLKTWVLGCGLLLVSSLLNLSSKLSDLERVPLSVLSDCWDLALLLLVCALLVYITATLADYFIWYLRSKRAVERGGRCLEPHTRARLWGGCVLLGICAASILCGLSQISGPGDMAIWAYAFGGLALFLALDRGVLVLLKRRGCSRETTRAVSIGLVVALAILYTGSLVPFGRYLAGADWAKDPDAAYLYTTHYGSMEIHRSVYRDPLPVTLEDLGFSVAEEDHCSYEAKVSRSPLLESTIYQQRAYGEDSDLPTLTIRRVTTPWDGLYQRCLTWLLEEYWYESPVPVDDPRRGAEAVYAAEGFYLLDYGDQLLTVSASWDLAEEQMGVIVEGMRA